MTGGGHTVAAVRRGIEKDASIWWEQVPPAKRLSRSGAQAIIEEQVGSRQSQRRRESLPGKAEGLHVVVRCSLRRREAEVVVAMDPNGPNELLVGAERLVDHAVTDLLERTSPVPGLDAIRAGARADDVHRKKPVVDDEHARRREVVARTRRLPCGCGAADDAGCRSIREDLRRNGWCPPPQFLLDIQEVAAELGPSLGGEDDMRAQRHEAPEGEADTHRDHSQSRHPDPPRPARPCHGLTHMLAEVWY